MPRPPHPARAEIIALLRQGLPHREIAERFSVGEPSVAKIARQEGIVRRQGRRKGDRREAVLVLIEQGIDLEEIRYAFCPPISYRSVQNYAREARTSVGEEKST